MSSIVPTRQYRYAYNRPVSWQFASILPAWVLAVVGAALVLALSPAEGDLTWFSIVLALVTIATFAIQLGIRRSEGFVLRVMASVTGAVVALGVATVIALVVA